jgi:hypothetical protein
VGLFVCWRSKVNYPTQANNRLEWGARTMHTARRSLHQLEISSFRFHYGTCI